MLYPNRFVHHKGNLRPVGRKAYLPQLPQAEDIVYRKRSLSNCRVNTEGQKP